MVMNTPAPTIIVTLSAVDGGSGVKEIRYTTNGEKPTSTTGFVYAGPLTISRTTTHSTMDRSETCAP